MEPCRPHISSDTSLSKNAGPKPPEAKTPRNATLPLRHPPAHVPACKTETDQPTTNPNQSPVTAAVQPVPTTNQASPPRRWSARYEYSQSGARPRNQKSFKKPSIGCNKTIFCRKLRFDPGFLPAARRESRVQKAADVRSAGAESAGRGSRSRWSESAR